MTHDDERLRELADKVIGEEADWYTEVDLLNGGIEDESAAFIAACSPDRILDLLRRLEEAEREIRLMRPWEAQT